jgi:hypothetical protein
MNYVASSHPLFLGPSALHPACAVIHTNVIRIFLVFDPVDLSSHVDLGSLHPRGRYIKMVLCERRSFNIYNNILQKHWFQHLLTMSGSNNPTAVPIASPDPQHEETLGQTAPPDAGPADDGASDVIDADAST